MINDIRKFDTWNPYSRKDPQMKSSYSGPASGPGARSDFDGKKTGTGSLEIVQATLPSEVKMRLNMTAPFKGNNTVVFTLVPQGNTTQAIWAMESPAPFVARLMGVIFNMDKMVGSDFEAGAGQPQSQGQKV